jgi:hemerythrin
MAIRWNESLATGLDWQDEQHKELFSRINGLLEAMHRNEASTVIGELFQFLSEYSEKHFGQEEKAMTEAKSAHAAQHYAMHRQFRERLHELETIYEKQGASSYLVMHVQRWLHDWLIQHIHQMDKQLAADVSSVLKS